MVVIRLARTGAKKRPFYHIAVADKRAPRDGRFIERIGFYDPIAAGKAERVRLDLERVDHWIGVGAQPTQKVASIIKQSRKEQSLNDTVDDIDAAQPDEAEVPQESEANASSAEVADETSVEESANAESNQEAAAESQVDSQPDAD